ncbi:dihydroorotase [Yunchengibacter salinarum]|uniref:dihydroorotase n=1 Tax=Yunchengibacter salinarum TaxID=3133399 RepID=UPI0035B5F174
MTQNPSDQRFDLVVAGGTLVTHAGRVAADVGVVDGRIAAIGTLDRSKADQVIAADRLWVLPGVIDTQVHFREPGATHKEDLESGSRAAVLGGVTALFEMPNTKPLTVDAPAIDDKLTRARGRMWCDHAFYLGATGDNAEALAELEMLPGVCGVKIFMGASTGDLLVPDDDTLLRVLRSGRRRVAVHAEDEPRMIEREPLRQEGGVAAHAVWRDEVTAIRATERLLKAARAAGRRVHVLHVTTAEEMALLARNKDIASVETTPQHLSFFAPDCYERLGSRVQMNPPVRDKRHQPGLWEAVANGVVDVIGSDHAPHTLAEKAAPYPESPSGMPGVQTLLPVLLTHMNAGRLTPERLVDLTSAGANRLFNLRDKGRLAVGMHADITLVDPDHEWTITDDWSASKCGWTPFDGFKATGKPVGTIIRGQQVMRDGDLLGRASGVPIRFQETLLPEAG